MIERRTGGGLNPSWIGSMLSGPLMDLCIKNDVIFTDTVRVLFFLKKVLSLLLFKSSE